MHVYFSGIGGAGIGPLALLAQDCGYEVSGSDAARSPFIDKLSDIDVEIGNQDGTHLEASHSRKPIEWLVYTAALPKDHPELLKAQELGIRVSKRDEFINHIIIDKNLKLVAVSGTHGKTTTTSMLIWTFHRLNIPVSYQVGTNLPWGASAQYAPNSEYFIYEADEYDRNMLQFHPFISVIPSLDYDHPDIYPTQEDYNHAFQQFAEQSDSLITWQSVQQASSLSTVTTFDDSTQLDALRLPGEQNRRNAYLVLQTLLKLVPDASEGEILDILADFPGTERRFEKLTDNLYTDYAHHPSELKAVISIAKDLSDKIVVVYQPHQDKRQRTIAPQYKDAFTEAGKVYWLPTYNPKGRDTQEALTPQELVKNLANPEIAEVAALDDNLKQVIDKHLSEGTLVVACSAGDLDPWLRQNFANNNNL